MDARAFLEPAMCRCGYQPMDALETQVESVFDLGSETHTQSNKHGFAHGSTSPVTTNAKQHHVGVVPFPTVHHTITTPWSLKSHTSPQFSFFFEEKAKKTKEKRRRKRPGSCRLFLTFFEGFLAQKVRKDTIHFAETWVACMLNSILSEKGVTQKGVDHSLGIEV